MFAFPPSHSRTRGNLISERRNVIDPLFSRMQLMRSIRSRRRTLSSRPAGRQASGQMRSLSRR